MSEHGLEGFREGSGKRRAELVAICVSASNPDAARRGGQRETRWYVGKEYLDPISVVSVLR